MARTGIMADKKTRFFPIFFKGAAQAAERFMFATMALINILLVSIILILVQIILVRKENNVFGHATNQRAESAA